MAREANCRETVYEENPNCFFCSQVLITAHNGAISSAEYWPSGLPAPEEDTWCVRVSVDKMFDEIQRVLDRDLAEGWQWDITVERLFSVIQAAYAGHAHEVSVSYGELGVPSHIAIDWFSDREDDRVEFSISDFRAVGQ